MAKKSPRPGRTLLAFFIGLAVAYALVAMNGTWKPALGLDLRGGTRITLIAEGSPTKEALDEARQIIDDRVNGSGVTEASVTRSGNNIQVEIPGSQRRDLIATVERQAQLRFRLVACDGTTQCGAPATAPPTTTTTIPPTASSVPTGPVAPTVAPKSPSVSAKPSAKPSAGATSSNRAPSHLRYDTSTLPRAKATSSPSAKPTSKPTSKPTATPTSKPSSSPSAPAPVPSSPPVDPATIDQKYVLDPQAALQFQSSPDAASVAQYNSFTCNAQGVLVDAKGKAANLLDDPTKPLVACGTPAQGNATQKFLLSPAVIEGSDVTNAQAQIPSGQVAYVVSIDMNGHGSKIQTTLSSAMSNDQSKLFAIVLDGQVISAPYYSSVITGSSQISGNFTLDSASSLATSLKFGALPIAFKKDVSAQTIGPSLAGDQLTAGLTAGAAGLILVMLYCLLYYRGLGVVVLSSLVVAAGLTYALVLLLSKGAGFTLTLPGIAGLIIAIGVTADSFIIFFERIRDEMRDGKSMRVAVEAGWVRARNTTLAADGVSLLAAVVLYIFAAGVVKGFAFALGLSTLIDLAVFFWFTKPLVTYLARYRFFSKGHRLSGLSRATLGIDRVPAGGKA